MSSHDKGPWVSAWARAECSHPTRDDIHDALEALSRARGQLEAALRVREPDPRVLIAYWRRAAGEVRVFQRAEREPVNNP